MEGNLFHVATVGRKRKRFSNTCPKSVFGSLLTPNKHIHLDLSLSGLQSLLLCGLTGSQTVKSFYTRQGPPLPAPGPPGFSFSQQKTPRKFRFLGVQCFNSLIVKGMLSYWNTFIPARPRTDMSIRFNMIDYWLQS